MYTRDSNAALESRVNAGISIKWGYESGWRMVEEIGNA